MLYNSDILKQENTLVYYLPLRQAVVRYVDMNQQKEHLAIAETINKLRFIRGQALHDNQGKLFEDSSETIREMCKERMQYLEFAAWTSAESRPFLWGP